jgi:cysteine desulfuration protein SufE
LALSDLLELAAMLRGMDRQDRIETLIEAAESFEPASAPWVPAKPFPEANRVPGCESEAFVFAHGTPEGVELEYAVLNPQGISAMALAALLRQHLSGLSEQEIAQVPDSIVFDLFGNELSMGKSMGLQGMVAATKSHAKAASRATNP